MILTWRSVWLVDGFMGKRLTIYKLYCPHKRFQKSLHWKLSNNHSPCCLWTGEWRLYLHLKMAVTSRGFKFTRKSISAPRHFYERTLFSVFFVNSAEKMSDKSWLGGMVVVVLQFPCRVNACVFRNLNGVISRSAWRYIDTKKSTPNSKDR